MNNKLKPCPFCGGKATAMARQIKSINLVYVKCTDCGVTSPIFHMAKPRIKNDENPAIETWNRRV